MLTCLADSLRLLSSVRTGTNFRKSCETLRPVLASPSLTSSHRIDPLTSESDCAHIRNMFTHDFAQGESTPMKYNTVVWGVNTAEPVDRSGISRFDSDGLGTLNLDSSFDLSARASQEFLVDVCDDLLSATTAVDGRNVPLIRQGGGLGAREINCFVSCGSSDRPSLRLQTVA